MIKSICYGLAKLSGWRYKDPFPNYKGNCVVIGAPHTSNWDFIPAMALIYISKVNAKFLIKSEWMFFPMNYILGSIGALGIERNKKKTSDQIKSTQALADIFKNYKDLCLMISPEGTRKGNEKWKTGFYYIAQAANVPIVMAYADFKTKTIGFSPVLKLTNFEEDMKNITNFYRPFEGKNRKQFLLDQRYR